MPVASSLAAFAQCLRIFHQFAAGRNTPVALEANPPSPDQQRQFLTSIDALTNGDAEALCYWAVQINVDPTSFTF